MGGAFLMSATAEEGSELTMHEIELGGAIARACAYALCGQRASLDGPALAPSGPQTEARTLSRKSSGLPVMHNAREICQINHHK